MEKLPERGLLRKGIKVLLLLVVWTSPLVCTAVRVKTLMMLMVIELLFLSLLLRERECFRSQQIEDSRVKSQK